ncbi:BCAS3 microtubule associated cell migration factor-like [Oratosquilla oratoria]|uniref:BCAS3 microtubule associated cell migration factor-like n=1 Tax=Oratosquilla oratoria TaxID=337810 RepID=UPI003F7726DA
MSGESSRGSRTSKGQVVRPEPVVEKSFVESVAGFINDVPQSYHNPSHYEGKETITWVRFDFCDINDFSQFRDKIETNGNSPPLLLIVGYTCGVQVWVIPANGDAVEVLSWRQSAVRTLKILPTPYVSPTSLDTYSLKRPLIALCDSAGPGPQFCSVTFMSLRTGEQVKTIKFKSAVHDVQANQRVVVISFPEKLAVFGAATLEDKFTVTSCYPCPGPSLNPVALGNHWLAYADRRLVPLHQSCGGMVAEGVPSYKASVIYAAKSLTKVWTYIQGLKEFGESVACNLMGQRPGSTQPISVPITSNQPTVGVVTILDTQRVAHGEVTLNSSVEGIIAHFTAHQGSPIVALQFDPSGMLLLTADKQGHSFHLFRIFPHPLTSAQTAVHHLYTLYRGDTTAKVTDITFSLDSRWVAVSTHRGTTHVFPITPYGGNIGVRTHTSKCVVNRLSRFQRSAGLDDTPSSGRNSPVLSASPGGSKFFFEPSPNMAYPNPRYPPYPTPTVVKPLAQLRQPLLQNLIETIASGPSPSRSPPGSKTPRSPSGDYVIKVAAMFGGPRGWLAGSPTVPHEKQHNRPMDVLFVMAYHGNLIEYQLDPRPIAGVPKDKITDDSKIELDVQASAQWLLVRESTSGEIRPPLDHTSPLLTPLTPRQRSLSPAHSLEHDDPEERWMAQVEIHTHAGPHRRLWMGPQFTFKTVQAPVGSRGGDGHGGLGGTCEIPLSTPPATGRPPRSSPVNMPGSGGANVPVLIEAGSLTSSHDQSPRLTERFSGDDPETKMTQLRQNLADAMLDTHGHGPGNAGVSRVPNVTRAPCSMKSLGPPLLGTLLLGDDDDSSAAGGESAFDMTDVMDISCDPPGPSSSTTQRSRPSSVASAPRASPYGDEAQSIVGSHTRLVSVARSQPVHVPGHQAQPPSLEEMRTLTSSAEELAGTLTKNQDSDSMWLPIEQPKGKVQCGSPEFVKIERPKPRQAENTNVKTSKVSETGTWEAWGKKGSSPSPQLMQASFSSSSSLDVANPSHSSASDRITSPHEMSNYQEQVKHQKNSSSIPSSQIKSSISLLTPLSNVVSSSLSSSSHSTTQEVSGSSHTSLTITLASPSLKVSSHSVGKFEESSSTVAGKTASPIPPPPLTNDQLGKYQNQTLDTQQQTGLTSTSEDDLWLTSESKKDKKKKKRKNKVETEEKEINQSKSFGYEELINQEVESYSHHPVTLNMEKDVQVEKRTEIFSCKADIAIKNRMDESESMLKKKDVHTEKSKSAVGINDFEMETDHFHAAEEYHEPCLEDFQEAHDTVVHNLEQFELKVEEEEEEDPYLVEKDEKDQEGMLRSIHDDNDLAKALEEAYSSDDNVPVKVQIRHHSKTRSSRPSEMFPFKDHSSDEEEDEVKLRHRVVKHQVVNTTATSESSADDRGETSGDDRGESSADDRKATSESDVGASPNPRSVSSRKGKKKKKKR